MKMIDMSTEKMGGLTKFIFTLVKLFIGLFIFCIFVVRITIIEPGYTGIRINKLVNQGVTVENISTKKGEEDFNGMQFYNAVAASLCGFLVFLFVRNLPTQSSNRNYISSINQLIRNKDYVFFITIICLAGISRAAMTMGKYRRTPLAAVRG